MSVTVHDDRLEIRSSNGALVGVVMPSSSGGVVIQGQSLAQVEISSGGTIRLQGPLIELNGSVMVNGYFTATNAMISGVLTHNGTHTVLGKCGLCEEPAYIRRNTLLVCDTCHFMFTRNPHLERLHQKDATP